MFNRKGKGQGGERKAETMLAQHNCSNHTFLPPVEHEVVTLKTFKDSFHWAFSRAIVVVYLVDAEIIFSTI